MPLTQNHNTHTIRKTTKNNNGFMRWANARCPHCGLPIHDWMPVAVPGPQERIATPPKRK